MDALAVLAELIRTSDNFNGKFTGKFSKAATESQEYKEYAKAYADASTLATKYFLELEAGNDPAQMKIEL